MRIAVGGMASVFRDLVLRPLKLYVVSTRQFRYAFSDYFNIFEEGDSYWIVGFEDCDDFDYNEPKIKVEVLNNSVRITGLEFEGDFHDQLYYGSILVFDLPKGHYTNFGTKTVPIVYGLDDLNSLFLALLHKILTTDTVNVDTLATENSVDDEIDTRSKTPPVVVLTPPSGKRISTRGVYLFSNSDAGEVEVRYMNSGKLVTKLYCDKFKSTTLPLIHTKGDVDDPMGIYWSGLSSGAKIFYVIGYKFV